MPVAVINETIAKREFPGENPLGKRIRLSRKNPLWYTVVGVVRAPADGIQPTNLAAADDNYGFLGCELAVGQRTL